MSAEQIPAGKKCRLYGSLDNKRLRTIESKASRVIKEVGHCLHLRWKSLFLGHIYCTPIQYTPTQVLVILLSDMSLYFVA